MRLSCRLKDLFSCVYPTLLAIVLFAAPLEARPKVDVLIFKNGDRWTCEIKKLTHGQLHVKTDYTIGTIIVDWKEVERIETPQLFQVETEAGDIYTGALEKRDPTSDDVAILEDDTPVMVTRPELVLMRQMDRGFWSRTKFKIDYGFSFTKANSNTQSNLNASGSYFTEKHEFTTRASSIISSQSDGVDTNRLEVTNIYTRTLRWKKWFGLGLVNFLKNDEQQLDLRSTFGGGLGRQIIVTNRTELTAIGGFTASNERFTPDSGREKGTNPEALLGLRFSMFRFDSTEFSSRVLAYPNLSDLGRVRIDFISDIKLDLVGDLYFNVSFWDNYDSRPPAKTAKNDFGITTSLGWSFN